LSKIKVAVVFGGRSVEHEISILSAKSIVKRIDRDKFELIPIYIEKTGTWRKAVVEGWLEEGGFEFSRNSFLSPSLNPQRPLFYEISDAGTVGEHEVGAVFPVLHGTYGEDGTVQGMFELMGLPFVGASVLGSSVGMDKILMKAVLRESGLPVVDYMGFYKFEWETTKSGIRQRILDEIGLPCFVKSADLGSSVGITKVSSEDGLDEAVGTSCRFSNRILVEKAVVNPREIEVSVLGNNEPIASCAGEIVPGREFYDYTAKYLDDSTELIAPAKLEPQITARLGQLAVSAFKALDSSGMGRVDFLMDRQSQEIFIMEINTIPGFTQISMYPRLWELSGIPYTELITRLIELAIERSEYRKGLQVDISNIQKTP